MSGAGLVWQSGIEAAYLQDWASLRLTCQIVPYSYQGGEISTRSRVSLLLFMSQVSLIRSYVSW